MKKHDLATQIGGVASTSDAVEDALGYALRKAADAGEWGLVGQLATELDARRKARVGVVRLDLERERRKRK
jgi:hypothetical protein